MSASKKRTPPQSEAEKAMADYEAQARAVRLNMEKLRAASAGQGGCRGCYGSSEEGCATRRETEKAGFRDLNAQIVPSGLPTRKRVGAAPDGCGD